MKKISLFKIVILLCCFFSCEDEETQEVQEVTYYEDLDNDGIGNENTFIVATEQPTGYVVDFGDFDDANEDVQTIEDASLALVKALEGDDTYALETYVNQDVYIQHNQSFNDGVATVIAAIQSGYLAGTTYELSRIMTDTNDDGDTIVILHGIYAGNWNSGNPQVAFDVFRFDAESGLVEEHWDNLISPTDPLTDALNGNTQLDGETTITDTDLTETNKSTIQDFFTSVMVGGKWETLAAGFFPDSGEYIQHSPGVENGIEWFADLGDDYQKYDTESPRFIYGEGNFVLTLSQGNETLGLDNIAYYDLFRLEDGKIVEHWDVIQEILSDEDAANTNGKW